MHRDLKCICHDIFQSRVKVNSKYCSQAILLDAFKQDNQQEKDCLVHDLIHLIKSGFLDTINRQNFIK